MRSDFWSSLIFGLVHVISCTDGHIGQTDRQTECEAYEPTMHKHRWAQKLKTKIVPPYNPGSLTV